MGWANHYTHTHCSYNSILTYGTTTAAPGARALQQQVGLLIQCSWHPWDILLIGWSTLTSGWFYLGGITARGVLRDCTITLWVAVVIRKCACAKLHRLVLKVLVWPPLSIILDPPLLIGRCTCPDFMDVFFSRVYTLTYPNHTTLDQISLSDNIIIPLFRHI